MKFAEYAKMYVALVGLIAAGVAGVPDIPLGWKLPLEIVIAVVGAFAVWKVENRTPEPPAPNWSSPGPAWDEQHVMPVDVAEDNEPLKLVHYTRQESPQLRLVA